MNLNGKIITFYSYAGGVGRTMTVANTAWILACSGYQVLAIDWDITSPGLHRYFRPFLKDADLSHTQGLADGLANGLGSRHDPAWLDSCTLKLDTGAGAGS